MEYLPDFKVHRPETIEDAVRFYALEDNARFLAGGTDMVVNIRRGIEVPDALVDLTAVAELKSIRQDSDGIHIGAAVPLEEVALNEVIAHDYVAVAEAAASIAGPTHQRYGTVGGNLCLDTRCIYYNQSEWWRSSNDYCLKHRGDVCHVAPSGKFCFAAFSGDLAPAAMVHGAEIDLIGPGGARRIALADLYRNDGMDHLTLKAGELVTALHLPKSTAGLPSAYTKSRVRGSIDFPLAGAAVALRMDNGAVAELHVALTACNPYPQMIKGTDAFTGKPLDEPALDRLRENVRTQAKPMKTTTIAPWYRRRVVGALARRLAARLAAA
jgi:4-hydroxybenzoyl-CoA reductase subunit beta